MNRYYKDGNKLRADKYRSVWLYKVHLDFLGIKPGDEMDVVFNKDNKSITIIKAAPKEVSAMHALSTLTKEQKAALIELLMEDI